MESDKDKIGKLESEITVMKRSLLQDLSHPDRDGQFEYTKAVLLGSFIVPTSISKREFAPDSHVVRRAADLNNQFYDLLEKKEKLRRAGLTYKLDELKAKKPAELLDDKILAQYNILARKEWEDRLIEELLSAKRVSNLEKIRQENRRNALENDMPDMEPEEVADEWLATHQEAEDLIRKYAGKDGGVKEPHIVEQVNFNHLQERNKPEFESQFKSHFQNQGSGTPEVALAQKKPDSSRQINQDDAIKPQSQSKLPSRPPSFPDLPPSNPQNPSSKANPPSMIRPSTPKTGPQPFTQPAREPESPSPDPQKPPSRQQSRDFVKKPTPPHGPAPPITPDPHIDDRSELARSEQLSADLLESAPAHKIPQVAASKAEVNAVLGDSFPVVDFVDEDDEEQADDEDNYFQDVADDDQGMFMPDSVLRPLTDSKAGDSRGPAGDGNGVGGSSIQAGTLKTVEIKEEDLQEFEDLDDFEF